MENEMKTSFYTVRWEGGPDGTLSLLDQRKLPDVTEYLTCRTVEQAATAIATLAVRGAPAIGVTAAYGICLGMHKAAGKDFAVALTILEEIRAELASSRPTAVNLFWALERMSKAAERFAADNPAAGVWDLRQHLLAEAHAICEEDRQMCRAIGKNGQPLLPEGGGVLTHCNAGALATAGIGTALAAIYTAYQMGKRFTVYVDETRPVLQGARLTAWELMQYGIPSILICDNMAAWLMKSGKIQAIITGADRIAANGDTANKIGTLGLSILAKQYRIPFYIAAPSSTFDLSIRSGGEIPIEERPAEEVRSLGGIRIAPTSIPVYNPAFDVTDAAYITAIITEKGVLRPPLEKAIKEYLEPK
jgi:methylthioribose-1-phosphate isomerase